MLSTHNIYWLFGRSAAGKTTLAEYLVAALLVRGVSAVLLDGDVIRKGISRDLGFGPDARNENQRRIAELAKLLAEQGLVVVVATAAQELRHRETIEWVLGENFQWIYIKCGIETCIRRNPHGRYDNNPALVNYEFGAPTPRQRAVTIDTEELSIEQSTALLSSTVIAKVLC